MVTSRSALCSAFAAIVVFGTAATANAQSTVLPPVGVSLRAGVFLPVNGDTQDIGNDWFAFGAEYRIAKLNEMDDYRASCSLSVDYFSRNSVSVTPILLNYVIHEKGVNGFFASVGGGFAFDHGLGASNTHFAYQGGVGYDLPMTGVPLFLEGKFWGNDNAKFNGFGLYVGVHF